MKKIYLLQASNKSTLEQIRKLARPKKIRSGRFLFISDEPPDKKLIYDERPISDLRYLHNWENETLLDDLHREYIDNSPISPIAAQAVRRKFSSALSVVNKKQAELDKAKNILSDAARKLVTHFGKSPINIDGKIYDLSVTQYGKVFLLPKFKVLK